MIWCLTTESKSCVRFSCVSFSESGTVNIRGGNVTVALNHQVEFQCNISAWYPEPDVGWALNDVPVDSSLYNTTSMLDGDLYHSTSVLNFKAVSNSTVECWANVSALSDPISSSVFLVVGKKIKHFSFNMSDKKDFVHTALFGYINNVNSIKYPGF